MRNEFVKFNNIRDSSLPKLKKHSRKDQALQDSKSASNLTGNLIMEKNPNES